MLVRSHHSDALVERQGLSLVEDSWALEVVPRLPANLAEQARAQSLSAGAKPCDPTRPLAGCIGLCLGTPLDAPAGCLGGAGGGRRYFRSCVA